MPHHVNIDIELYSVQLVFIISTAAWLKFGEYNNKKRETKCTLEILLLGCEIAANRHNNTFLIIFISYRK